MPAIHLQARFMDNAGSGGISATAIALLIGVGLVPAFILIWVVCWLLFAYPSDRNLCCCVRKRKADTAPEMLQRRSTDTSQETLCEKAAYPMPKRPYAAHARTESGSSTISGEMGSYGNGRLSKAGRPGWQSQETRMSMQSQGSASTIAAVEEPKRFV